MALRIETQAYHGNGRCQNMPADEATKFRSAVEKALGEILAVHVGVDLRKEIDSADRYLTVLKAGPGQVNKCTLQRQDKADRDSASYKEVLDVNLLRAKIQELLSQKVLTQDHPAVKKFIKFYVYIEDLQYLQYLQKPDDDDDYDFYPLAHKRRKPAHQAAHMTDNILRDRVNYGEPSDKIAEAESCVRLLQNGLIGYHIMSHLTPGSGAEAVVVWNPEGEDPGAGLPASKRAAWMTRPSWISLVHELIHGWRLVTGRCVFRPDKMIEEYYEEAMTVGLPPYDACKFTENKFRSARGEALRMFYGEQTRVLSEAAQKKHPMMDESVWAPGEANPPYDRLLHGALTYGGQSEEKFKRELEAVAVEAARKSTRKDLRVFIFGPIEQLDEIIKWTEATIRELNSSGYKFRIRRTFFDGGTQQVRFYDHLRSG